jgi:hypothetical protein
MALDLSTFQHLDTAAHVPARMNWSEVERMTRSLEPKTNLVVPKSVLPDAPPYKRSGLGRSRGADRQYRCHRGHFNLHIKEFLTHWVVHVDRYNPHRHVLRHLFVDHGFRAFLHVAQILVSPMKAGATWVEDVTATPTPTPTSA